MNPSPSNVNLHLTLSQMPVVRFDHRTPQSQIVPLQNLENDIIPDMLIPHVYITEGSLSLHNGPEKNMSAENQITVLTEARAQFYNIKIEADKTLAQTKSLVSNSSKPFQTSQSKQLAEFDEQTELMQPLEYISKSTPINNESIHKITNLQPLSYTSKIPIKRKNYPEVYSKDNDDQSSKTVRRKVQNYIHVSDVKVPQRAIAVLPTALQIRGRDNIFPRRTLPARIRFGPVEGIHKVVTQSQTHELLSQTDVPVFLMKKDDQIVHIDVSDKDKCNWMGLLPHGGAGEANVWLYQEDNELYAITTEPINARRPLKLGYSKKYAEDHKLPTGQPTLDLETVLSSNPKQWWCNECNRALPSASLLQRHADIYHKDDIISTRRGYRCLQCRRMFSRLFTLRRHISKHCTKKIEKTFEVTEANISLELSSTLINEDHRIPSDESFQNFTNGLDFTTSLFDADRISNLDISSNSRADDFNPYDISFRDDTCTSTDLGFSKLAGPSTNIENKKKTAIDPCTYCGQVLTRGNRRKHLSECSSRKLECACGKSFRNKEKLAQHFIKEHPADSASKTDLISPEKKNYTCEQCTSKRFKRRGMLVNHLWRAHKIVSTTKVERPVRHYPCVACSKIYRSAAKRDRHIAVHHPGAEKLATQSIAGGVKSCEPAACPHCPRQYATRAKLLQHVRAHHTQVENAQAVRSKENSIIVN